MLVSRLLGQQVARGHWDMMQGCCYHLPPGSAWELPVQVMLPTMADRHCQLTATLDSSRRQSLRAAAAASGGIGAVTLQPLLKVPTGAVPGRSSLASSPTTNDSGRAGCTHDCTEPAWRLTEVVGVAATAIRSPCVWRHKHCERGCHDGQSVLTAPRTQQQAAEQTAGTGPSSRRGIITASHQMTCRQGSAGSCSMRRS